MTVKYSLVIDDKTISSGNSSSATFDNVGVVSLYDVAFNRKLYSPNELIADIQVEMSTDETGKAIIPTNKTLQDTFVGQKARFKVKVDSTTQTFSNLYIHQIIPLREGSSTLYIRLKAFSMDHQLTLRKYSRTYVGKRLGRDILLEGLEKVTEAKNADLTQYWYNKKLATLNFATDMADGKNFKGKDDVGMTKYLQHLKFTPKGNGTQEELILPYLVQYNESFYDFLVRTANRCGEFLYFEEGKLHFGIHHEATNLASSITDSECKEVYGKMMTHVDDDYTCLEEVNEVWVDNDQEDWIVNASKGEKGAKVTTAVGDDSLKYNFEINEEPYHTRLFKDKFAAYSLFMKWKKPPFWLKMVSKALQENSIYNMMKKILAGGTMEAAQARLKTNDAQSLNEKGIYVKLHKVNEDLQKSSDGDESITPFVAQGGVASNSFYQKIRKGELAASEQAMTFNLGTNVKIMELGQQFTYNEETYVVIHLKICPNINKQISKFAIIDKEYPADLNEMSDSVMQVVAVPLNSDKKIYPPMHPKGHVRHADPQVAFVTDHGFMDPRNQGSVRIRYPWESKDSVPSPWLRVVVPSSVSSGGFYSQAGTGDEVLVCYEGGNIERPYIGGYLRSRTRGLVPKGDMYVISKNGHGLLFDDPVDDTLFFKGVSPSLATLKTFMLPLTSLVPSLRDLPLLGTAESDDADLLKTTGGISLRDAYGFYNISMSTDQRQIDISSPFGKVGINAFTGISISAPNGDISIKGKNVTIEAGNKVSIVSGKNVEAGHGDVWKKKGGGAWPLAIMMEEAVTDFLKQAIQVIDLDLLRTLVETFLHPISGSLQIKSFNYLMLEAGKGSAVVRPDRYKNSSQARVKLEKDTETYRHQTLAIKGLIEKTSTKTETMTEELIKCANSLAILIKSYNERRKIAIQTKINDNDTITTEECAKSDKIIKDVFDAGSTEGFTYLENLPNTKFADLKFKEGALSKVPTHLLIGTGTTLSKKAGELYKVINKWSAAEAYNDLVVVPGEFEEAYKSQFYGHLKTQFLAVFAEKIKNNNDLNWKSDTAVAEKIMNLKSTIKHIIFAKVIDAIKADNICPITTDMNANAAEADWLGYVKSISIKPKPKDEKTAGQVFSKNIEDITKSWKETIEGFKDREMWVPDKHGQIIFSDQPNQSNYFDSDGSFHQYVNGTDYDFRKDLADL